ncbi:MAG: glycosyltransferase family 4 protein [Anaerolineales bacterium]|jgi:glycosyltransferase involved in cell wall biosynthesis
MKIAHIFQSSGVRFSEPGAAQLHIYYTMRGLQQAGHLVTLIALQQNREVLCAHDLNVFSEEDAFGKNPICSLGWSGNPSFKLFESGVRRFQREAKIPYFGVFDSLRLYDACYQNLQGYDLVHERFNLLAIGGALASRRLGIPLVLEINADLIAQRRYKGRPERGLRRRFAIWAMRFSFDTAAKIVCISRDLKNHLMRHWGINEPKLAVLPCAVDADAFVSKRDPGLIREEIGLNGEPVIMWIGGFYKWHNLELLIESFAKILLGQPKAKLVLVGDGETRPTIEKAVKEQGLEQSVIFTGKVSHDRVPDILSIADVAVVSSAPASAEDGGTGTPLKLFEYMAAGKPIVASDVNHNAAIIQNGYDGKLVPPGDVNGFARVIESLLKNPDERNRLGQNARRAALERHSWENYTRQLEIIYSDVC